MPWKGETNPYRIWLSEIILQQTRVEQGRAYYEKFILSFPAIQDLARATEKDVFKHWEGLGYYSRCRNLIATARRIVQDYEGQFPSSYADILALPGIGPYTASAIASFAFSQPHAVVDGNVERVLARYFGISAPTQSAAEKNYTVLLPTIYSIKVNPHCLIRLSWTLGQLFANHETHYVKIVCRHKTVRLTSTIGWTFFR